MRESGRNAAGMSQRLRVSPEVIRSCTSRPRANLVDCTVDDDCGLPGCAAISRSRYAADVDVCEEDRAVCGCGDRADPERPETTNSPSLHVLRSTVGVVMTALDRIRSAR